MSSALRVETFTSGLKQVRNAKESLEGRLHEKRNKRKELEALFENVNSKMSQVKDLHSKMLDTMKMAQHKVSQSQALCDRMEASNQDKRAFLQKVEDQIEGEEAGRVNDVQQVKEDLSIISKTMVDARNSYMEDNLKTTIQKLEGECENYNQKRTKLEVDEAELELYLTSLGGRPTEELELDIDKPAIWKIFRSKQLSLLKYLQGVNKMVEDRTSTVA